MMLDPAIKAVLDGESQGCVVCADCLDVLPLMPAASIDLVWTDPPYGQTGNGSLMQRREAVLGWQDGKGIYRDPKHHAPLIMNDGPEAGELFRKVLPKMRRLLKPGCCCCCCCCGGGGGPDTQFARWSLWLDEVFDFKQMIVWDKGPMGMGWHYRRSYETVLVGQVPGAACRWYGGHSVENIIRPGMYGIRKIIPSAQQHPTAKPVELAAAFIRWHTQIGEIVLDPFCGAGPCLEAALRLGRKYIGIELDPHWAEVAHNRLAGTERPLFTKGTDHD